jgi:pimeloyl-ACP methyl ester carboxylesterase
LLLAFAASAWGNPPADWIRAPDARAEYVEEPVFGGRVAVYRAGPKDAQAVVLLHGLGSPAARDWSNVIPALARKYQVIVPDLPGFGHSSKGNHHYSPDNYAAALHAVLGDVKRFALVGHSMGASVAIAYAAAHPERVSHLVLVNAAGVLHRSVYVEFLALAGLERAIGADSLLFNSLSRAIRRRAESWPPDVLALERAGVRQRLLGGEPAAIAAVGMTGHDFSEELRGIQAPALVVWGAEDRIAPPRTGQALASAIPHARLVVFEAVGHAPQVQAPDQFNALLIDELDGAPVALAPYALAPGPVGAGGVTRCKSTQGQQFSGEYEVLVLEDCGETRISNSRIGRLEALRSSVRIVNSHIRDGVQARQSRLEITGGSLGGALVLDDSSVDAAATRFASKLLAANQGDRDVVLRLSIAELSRAGYAPRTLHDIFRLAPGETLIR